MEGGSRPVAPGDTMAGVTAGPSTARLSRGSGTRRWPVPLLLGRLVGVVLLAALLLPVAVAARVVQVAGRDERAPADAILVLGASQLDGRPGPVLEARLQHALELFRQGLAPRVVTTGANQEGDRYTEAGSALTWLVDNGVPADAVVVVPVGGNTFDSLVPVAGIAATEGWQQGVLVVSDPWHVYRVRTMADDLGLPVAGASPTRTGPSTELAGREVAYVARETAGVLVQSLGLAAP